MKRIVAIVAAVIVLAAGVGYAADAAVPTLADVMTTLAAIRADLAVLKADGFTKANASGKLASVSTKDGLVSIEVTSVLAGQDATVVGIQIINKTSDKHLNTLSTSVVAGGKKVEVLHEERLIGDVLPGTTQKGLLLLDPLPNGSTELTIRSDMYDSKTYDDILEATLVVKLPK